VLDGRPGTFGAALAGSVDVTGDGKPDLVVGSPAATFGGEAAGAVFVFAGGFAALAEKATPLVPWAIAVGDGRERGQFGVDLALAPAAGSVGPLLVVGAPMSYRTGTQNGTAFALPLRF
jgi:hypothetical protein